MASLIMYSQSDDAAQFCMSYDWEMRKKQLHGKVNYAIFPLKDLRIETIANKIAECQDGAARAVGGGHICLK